MNSPGRMDSLVEYLSEITLESDSKCLHNICIEVSVEVTYGTKAKFENLHVGDLKHD